MNLGTLPGRHPMPVDLYLFTEGSIDVKTAPEQTKARVENFLVAYPDLEWVNLFYTGLTEVTLVAFRELTKAGVAVTPWRYDRDSDSYKPY